MKLHELREAMAAKSKGTYAGVRFCEDTKQSLWDYMRESHIPNMLDKDKLHTTLLYSRTHCPDYEPARGVNYVGTPGDFVVWDTKPSEGSGNDISRCLVLKYDCPELEARHKALRKEHGATHDYPEFNSHITLSYDIGDADVKSFPDVRKFLDKINIIDEYKEDLDLDWADNKGKN